MEKRRSNPNHTQTLHDFSADIFLIGVTDRWHHLLLLIKNVVGTSAAPLVCPPENKAVVGPHHARTLSEWSD